jgi:hypothetical protein
VVAWVSQPASGQTASQAPAKPAAAKAAPAAKGAAGSWTVPKTPDGQPDLNGVWNFGTDMPLTRPNDLADKTRLTPEEAAKYNQTLAERKKQRLSGTNRYSGEVFDDVLAPADWTKQTSLITDPPDGKFPPMTAEAQKRKEERTALVNAPGSAQDLYLADRCILGWHEGPPITPSNQSNVVQFMQSKDYFVIYNELNHDARIIPTTPQGVPRASSIPEYTGTSRGHWEGNTLVIETDHFTTNGIATLAFNPQGGTTEAMHLIEKITRTGPNEIKYEFTINDPKTWTKPWSASFPMLKTNEKIYEYACHEGNYSIEAMVGGQREKEKAEREGKAAGEKPKE